ncbi:hypothetical protein C5E45_17325 [Nocardia nova]|uniref:SnoaL-like domain-containing protein n=1 Tax=Nocardia nova TaxID=37330 RepID=A0A2S6AP45_9NOCA|nr:hypothetical protein C5E41_12640 [Nocardia nova]PPJ36984.1 hypothetical protein C5E45_17325 [Nocardia nova]
MARHLASDVIMYQASSLPYGGEWHGHDGFRQFITAMGDSWDGLWFDDQQFLSDGDRVVVFSRGRLRFWRCWTSRYRPLVVTTIRSAGHRVPAAAIPR